MRQHLENVGASCELGMRHINELEQTSLQQQVIYL
jgi:hypothetical protein